MLDTELWSILLPAFAAGLLVLSTHVVLGQQVLKRGIIFIDLAIAQIAALGAIVAHIHHDIEAIAYSNFWMPAIFALAGAGVISWLAKHFESELEAFIGCFYVLSAVAAMLMLANDPHGGELLTQLMSGQILWVSWSQLAFPALIYAMLLALLMWRSHVLNGSLFYFVFAIVITLSVELVGVYLVFSTLILPALALNQYKGRGQLAWAYLVGIIGYCSGLMLSASFDLPSGAAIVATLAVTALLCRIIVSKQDKSI
ncbi:metal ABC transporter permease [Shewanella intestini]|uniref:Metal ABC transporter permease n=1 Tax=Shewanella intestini TaxID=2017544 RepID=A0ABS5I0P4_9GAMM|nr:MULTISPECIES: metal ABC transporter permease [Shewanella]MBR9727591.1 metal ABC transporter permease [Shewanella intestini]MRG35259.1 metal ABC transporter permease [Shewanella sp. XMDDZSB0408]